MDLDISVAVGKDLKGSVVDDLLSLFDETYARANHDYLMASLGLLRWVAIARTKDKLVGFAIGNTIRTDLPRFDTPQAVGLAGISCISSEHRRAGLFSHLAVASLDASGVMDRDHPFLLCGRMAHPASYRAIGRTTGNTVPVAGQTITPWQRETIIRIAELYNVKVDPDTSRVIGKGRPIGYPRLEYEATKEELEVFAPIDRDKGDSLLAMSWVPEPPPGWFAKLV